MHCLARQSAAAAAQHDPQRMHASSDQAHNPGESRSLCGTRHNPVCGAQPCVLCAVSMPSASAASPPINSIPWQASGQCAATRTACTALLAATGGVRRNRAKGMTALCTPHARSSPAMHHATPPATGLADDCGCEKLSQSGAQSTTNTAPMKHTTRKVWWGVGAVSTQPCTFGLQYHSHYTTTRQAMELQHHAILDNCCKPCRLTSCFSWHSALGSNHSQKPAADSAGTNNQCQAGEDTLIRHLRPQQALLSAPAGSD